ncbi:ATP-grasp domain-containing protein [Leptospira langatensis]|uniref:ATP-grasp domain-containing protein n=1 Tax=Leptospira langatensis TaxID=2484983 RepID=A0A5F1ZWB9_9LEPT|nr:ATP-grasp domain-containing protein [Leptospira langatensis]TGJ98328.1 ATP-grasp domain-containing protein [Leptospira langatensis]TGL43241.1 ATP-grasp domain-containing protein [Leptospira langatensis]
MKKKQKKGYFLSLGAGKNQLPLISAARSLGLDVASVDKDDKAPGFALSSLRIIESTHEYRRILRAVAENPLPTPILGVGTRSFGKATFSAAYLAEKLKLRYASTDAVIRFSDKKVLKETLEPKGIRVPKEIPLTEIKAKSKSFPYPWIAKPSQGSGKTGVQLIESDSDLKHISNISAAKKGTKSKVAGKSKPEETWILEEYISGLECTVLGLIDSHDFHLVSLSLKETSSFPPFLEAAHRLPFPLTELEGEIKMQCRAITKATGLKNCPFVAEFRLDRNGEPVLIEAAPEVGGEYLADVLVPGYSGYDYFSNLVHLLIGEEIEPPPSTLEISKKLKSQVRFDVPPRGISVLKHWDDFPTYSAETILFQQNLKEPGAKLDTSLGNETRTRVLCIKTKSSNSEEEWNGSVQNRMKAEYDVR